MYTAVQTPSPFAIRYPRGKGVQNGWKNKAFELIPIGKAKQIKQGEKMAVLSIGHIGNQALKAAEWADEQANINTAVFDMRFLKPLDEEILHFVCQNYQYIISIENGTVIGGLGSAIAEFILQHNYKVTFKRMGIPDKFVEQGNIEELHHECGIDTDKIKETILQLIRNH
jgi:1-deoxy-D-xylulose-5-phosphate synthase